MNLENLGFIHWNFSHKTLFRAWVRILQSDSHAAGLFHLSRFMYVLLR